jgi:hypothetical protein
MVTVAGREASWPRYPRNAEGVWHAIEDLRDAVDSLRQADQIAEQVTEALVKQRGRFFTRSERLIALAVSVIIAVSSVIGAIYAIHGASH